MAVFHPFLPGLSETVADIGFQRQSLAMDYEPRTHRQDVISLAFAVGTFVPLLFVTTAERALVFSMFFGVFLSIVQTQPVERRDGRFWGLVGALAFIHLPLLALMTFDRFPFGMVVLPFALVDGLAMLALIKWTERRFPRA